MNSPTLEIPLINQYEIAWLGSQSEDPLDWDLVMARRSWSKLHDAPPPTPVDAAAASWQIALANTVPAEKAVRYHTKRGNHPTLGDDDLFQIALMGIFIGAKDYFPLRDSISGMRHARVSAGRAIMKYCKNSKNIVAVPEYLQETDARISRQSKVIDPQNGQEIGQQRARDILGLTDPETIKKLDTLRSITDMGNLDPITGAYFDSSGKRRNSPNFQSVTSTQEENGFDEVLDRMRAVDVQQWLTTCGLSDRELDILRRRFGLNHGEDPQTLEEVGKIYGLTRERIRQIEAGAFNKLRTPNIAEKICPSTRTEIIKVGYTRDPASGEFIPYEYSDHISQRII